MARWLVLVAIAGCYNEPRPACGFVCGEGASCPGGYTCNAADNRCHLDGTSAQCDSYVDAAPPEGPDTTPPMILLKTPANRADDVALNATIVVVFDEEVLQFGDGFQLHGSEGAFPCSATGVREPAEFEVTYTPSIPFTGRAVITAYLDQTVTDLAGNPLAPINWTFTTQADSTAPTVASTVPANGDTMVPTNVVIKVTFSEPINFTPSSITVDQGVTGMVTAMTSRVVMFTPDALAAATTYTVTVATDVTDLSGNPLASPFVFSFTTAM